MMANFQDIAYTLGVGLIVFGIPCLVMLSLALWIENRING